MKAALFFLVFLAVFQISACGSGSAQRAAQPSVDPLAALPSIPAAEISLTGETVARIADGDFVHPAFSPDGSKLAYSGVAVEDGTELTEVLVHDLTTKKRTNLLDSEASRKYAVYKSFVIGVKWKDANTLEAEISDGDVDSTIVSFDVRSGRIVSEEYGEGGDIFHENLLLDQALAAFPSWRKEVLDNALRNGYSLGEGRFIAQKDYAGEDDHVWLLDVESKQAAALVELPEGWNYSLGGAFAHGETIVFILRKQQEKTAHLLAYREGSVSRLAEVEATSAAWLHVKHASPERVIFLVQANRGYEQGNNPLFVFDGTTAKRVTDIAELYDVAIDPQGKRICYAAWVEGQRHLVVKELRQ